MAVNDVIVDAGRKGARVRFINHSCAPNCKTEIWVIRGRPVPALFTKCDVPKGTELTWDYAYNSETGYLPWRHRRVHIHMHVPTCITCGA